MIPPSVERKFTKLLINGLSGEAYAITRDARCETVTRLLDVLIETFSLSAEKYRRQLLATHHMRGRILKYIRMKDLRFLITDAEWRQYTSISTD